MNGPPESQANPDIRSRHGGSEAEGPQEHILLRARLPRFSAGNFSHEKPGWRNAMLI
jgi:hypothetical protein